MVAYAKCLERWSPTHQEPQTDGEMEHMPYIKKLYKILLNIKLVLLPHINVIF